MSIMKNFQGNDGIEEEIFYENVFDVEMNICRQVAQIHVMFTTGKTHTMV